MNPAEILIERERTLALLRRRREELETSRAGLARELAASHRDLDRALTRLARHDIDRVDWGGLARTSPLGPFRGADRGKPIDRYYEERFLALHGDDLRGDVRTLTGAPGEIATLERENCDCIVAPGLFRTGRGPRATIATCLDALNPGGILLATTPCAEPVDPEARPTDHPRLLTPSSVRRLLREALPPSAIEVQAYGNVLVMAAYLYGLAAEELTDEELATHDPLFPLLVGVRARRPRGSRDG